MTRLGSIIEKGEVYPLEVIKGSGGQVQYFRSLTKIKKRELILVCWLLVVYKNLSDIILFLFRVIFVRYILDMFFR